MKKKKQQKNDGKTKPTTKKQIERENIRFSSFPHKPGEKENKQLKNILICLAIFSFILISIALFVNSIRHFEYKGVKFDVVKEGNLVFYKTALPVMYNEEKALYNFYLRNDPRKLKNIPVEGEINLKNFLVINITGDFNCDGDGIIAIANLMNLYELFGIKIMKDENASCDAQGRYMFMQIQPGNKTSIEQFGPACYNLNVNDCEILKVTERLMLETFIKYHESNKEH